MLTVEVSSPNFVFVLVKKARNTRRDSYSVAGGDRGHDVAGGGG